jgi:hypothetical protein
MSEIDGDLAVVLARLYLRKQHENQVLGINLCFYDRNGSKFEEPIFIAANTRYQLGILDDKFKRGWDPWEAFLKWSPKRVLQRGHNHSGSTD